VRYHIVGRLQKLLRGSGHSFGTVLGVGKVVFGLVTSVVVVIIVTVNLLVDLPRVKSGIYQFAPRSRRARMVLLTDEILDRVGGYVLGNLSPRSSPASARSRGRSRSTSRTPCCWACPSRCST
jgi:predicted PurR-regulated permease PerM